MKFLLTFLALIVPGAAALADNVALSSQVYVERIAKDANGQDKAVLEEPKIVTPGEKLVFVLSYKNVSTEPATDFVITNPIPDAVAYASGETDGSVLSVDGGKTWGPLASLEVPLTDGASRPATPADVTHVRWQFAQAIPAGAEGKLTFKGVVK